MAKRETDDKGFISRWSQRKRDAQETLDPAEQASEKPPGDGAPGAGALDREVADAGRAEAPFDPADLPDIETLDKDSDFSVFMSEKVPDALRRRALRRLWRVDPSFAFLDGMNDYDEDYTDAALVVEGLKTVYQVGKGMVVAEEPDEPADTDAQPSVAHDSAAREPSEPESEDTVSAIPGGDEGQGESSVVEPIGAAGNVAAVGTDATPDSPGARTTTEPERALRKPAGGALRRRWGDHSG